MEQNMQMDGDSMMADSNQDREFKQLKRRNIIQNQSHSPPDQQSNQNQIG